MIQIQTKQLHNTFVKDEELFFEKALGVELWDKQREIVKAIDKHRRVSIRSCNGAGKTWLIPRIALRYLLTHKDSIVLNTAPSWRQIENQYWRYFRDAYSDAPIHIGGQMLKTQFNIDETWFAMGVASNVHNVANFQGWHGKSIMVIFDEASGIPKVIWEAVEGVISGGHDSKLVAIGNPNTATGDFADTFTDPRYHHIHISAFDIPNVQQKKEVIRGLSTYEWVEEMRLKYGEASDVWRVRVLGEPPQAETDTLISLALIEACFTDEREMYNENEEIIGLDVARFGNDKSAFVYRQGNTARVLQIIDKNDTMELAGKAKVYMREYPNAKLFIDIVGMGAGVFDRLREQPDVRNRVFGVNSASKAKDSEQYINVRMESWDLMRQWLKDAMLEKHDGWYEMAKPKYKHTSRGQLQLEGKEDMKKRGIASPNVADALALTFSRHSEGTGTGIVWI